MTQYFYGVKNWSHIFNTVHKVCNQLGLGNQGKAPDLCFETIAAETQMGTFPDTTTETGRGLCQFDPIGFGDVVARTRKQHKHIVLTKFGYELNDIVIDDLDFDPELSIIMMRLKYILRPEPIPETLEGRAHYWKRWYNSEAGKGTIEHYIKSAKLHLLATD